MAKQSSATNMAMIGHLKEVLLRVIAVTAVFLVGSVATYIYRDQVLDLILKPLKGQKLVYLNPAGGFSFIFMVSIYAGLALAAPFFITQLYGFLKPILKKEHQRRSVIIAISSMILLCIGVFFGYVYAIPGALNFLYDFADKYVDASLTADSYLSFIIAYTLGLGLVFQLPIILFFVHWIKPIKPSKLLKSERWVIVLAFVAAALITPTPDPLNQTIIATPIIAVYQFGVIAILLDIYGMKRKAKKEAKLLARAEAKAAALEKLRLKKAARTASPLPVPAAATPRTTKPASQYVEVSLDEFIASLKEADSEPVSASLRTKPQQLSKQPKQHRRTMDFAPRKNTVSGMPVTAAHIVKKPVVHTPHPKAVVTPKPVKPSQPVQMAAPAIAAPAKPLNAPSAVINNTNHEIQRHRAAAIARSNAERIASRQRTAHQERSRSTMMDVMRPARSLQA